MRPAQPGDVLDRYRLDSLVASSSMSTIFRATDLETGEAAAVKIPSLQAECDPVFHDRFKRELEIGKSLDHPGVIRVLGGSVSGRLYMATEWLEGKLLREILAEGKPLGVERSVDFAIQLAAALSHIHDNGVVHRDLKPENVMVAPNGNVKLIDFGIASLAGCRRLTFGKLSEVMGSPDYISPEQVRGKRGDARSDIYALGVILYEMLTGRTPFAGSNAFAIMNDRLRNDPVAPRKLNPGISPQLEETLRRALERVPKNRYTSVRDLASDLEHPELVSVDAPADSMDWTRRVPPAPRRVLSYAALALIPMLVFGLLLYVAQHP